MRYSSFALILVATLFSAQGSSSIAAEAATGAGASADQIDWTQYDGQRVKGSNSVWVYLILRGHLWLIPDAATYLNLFVDWNGVSVNNYLVNHVPRGNQLSPGAVLAKGTDDLTYVVANGHKLLIPDPPTFNLFYFSWNKILNLPDQVMESIPSGVQIY